MGKITISVMKKPRAKGEFLVFKDRDIGSGFKDNLLLKSFKSKKDALIFAKKLKK